MTPDSTPQPPESQVALALGIFQSLQVILMCMRVKNHLWQCISRGDDSATPPTGGIWQYLETLSGVIIWGVGSTTI